MKTPSQIRREASRDDSFMTPMIDVVFLLLIFFVCASVGQIRESHLPLPLSGGSIESVQPVDAPKPLGEIWLRVFRAAGGDRSQVTRVELNGSVYSDWAELQQTLQAVAGIGAEIRAEIPVRLDIAGAVPMEDVVEVIDSCRAARFENIQFVAHRETQ